MLKVTKASKRRRRKKNGLLVVILEEGCGKGEGVGGWYIKEVVPCLV